MTDNETAKVSWTTILPANATNITLPHPEIQGPYTSEGVECPWPWDPQQLAGVPMGMYHCGYCGEMQIAGIQHSDYGPRDEHGLNDADYAYLAYCRKEMQDAGASEKDILKHCGPVLDGERRVVALEEARVKLADWENEGGNGSHR